jgi:ATP-dependent Clp protease adaptor protein ClpS
MTHNNNIPSPKKYQVVLLNDNKTPTEFVVQVLQKIFQKTAHESAQIMMNIHLSGTGVVGAYTYEIAETRLNNVLKQARKYQHPLQGELEVIR